MGSIRIGPVPTQPFQGDTVGGMDCDIDIFHLAFKPWNIEAYWRLCHLIFVSHLFKWWCWRALLDLVGSQWFVIRLRRGIMWFHSHCWYSISMYIPVLAGRIPICLGRIPTNKSWIMWLEWGYLQPHGLLANSVAGPGQDWAWPWCWRSRLVICNKCRGALSSAGQLHHLTSDC